MNRKTTDWDKILAKQISGKGLVSRVYKELSKPKKKTIQFLKERKI